MHFYYIKHYSSPLQIFQFFSHSNVHPVLQVSNFSLTMDTECAQRDGKSIMNFHHGSTTLLNLKSRIKSHEKLSPFHGILDDMLLLGFLNGKNFDVDATILCLENYIYMRTVKYRKQLRPFLPSTDVLLDTELTRVLKNRDQNGRFVVIVKYEAWNPSVSSSQDVVASVVFFVDELTRSYATTCSEVIFIGDCKNFSFAQAQQAGPRIIMQAVDLFVKCIPSRPKAFHFVNENVFVSGLFYILRSFLSKKLRERLHIHSSNLELLHEHVPKEILPESLGGDLLNKDAYDEEIRARVRATDEFYKRMADIQSATG
ncbi:alpha-tocopherol transfer protein-like isoform X1 [Folsomia candida]|uniref:alpha-tocopherol transfer protein-like isoform X1 n=1 Tax=Folsomia candida TaxID=158441 RepID=UPI000B8F6433|nr:alpha-tocopherol transfer protein-like isoform X1 [Folsomia candida]